MSIFPLMNGTSKVFDDISHMYMYYSWFNFHIHVHVHVQSRNIEIHVYTLYVMQV